MKNIFKHCFALLLVVTLFAAPSLTSAASTSTPVLLTNTEGIKYFQYQPSPYYCDSHQAAILKDTTDSNGRWNVPAGLDFTFNVYFEQQTNLNYRIFVFNSNGSRVYDSGIISEGYPQVVIPAKATADSYEIWISAYSPFSIEAYDCFIY